MGQIQGQPQPLIPPPPAPAGAAGVFQIPPRQNFLGRRRRRGFRLNRVRYTEGQKENAIRLLNLGLSYRQVARMISPHCSSGTPHRWRREHLRRQEQRRRMDEMRRRRMY